MTKVTFTQDVFPHVAGTVVDLDADEKARVDAVAKGRNMGSVYDNGVKTANAPENDSREAAVISENRARSDREAAKQNAVDQAAQLEAQRNAVAEPANVDALGVKAEDPQVVTGTEPVEGVEVVNPQQATDISDPEGAKVKKSK